MHNLLHRAGMLAAVLLAAAAPLAVSQQPPANQSPELTSLLAHLSDNVDELNRTLPSLSCTEHVVSEMTPPPTGTGTLRITTDSIFRIRREDDPPDPNEPDGPNNITRFNPLQESRVVQRVNGRPTGSEKAPFDTPYVVFGIFSGGLARVSTAGNACFSYHLRRNDATRIVISYESWPPESRSADCPYTERISGEATIDPNGYRVLHLEDTTHDKSGLWTWSIDYAPVALGGHSFWLPTVLRSTNTSEREVMNPLPGKRPITNIITHSLTAHYADYHLRSVTSHIITDTSANPTEPHEN
ncbi:MAG TPA: hypothetical protein VGC07_11110 [Granulicella sp.]